MKSKLVTVPTTKKVIHDSPGFEKKELATHHLELAALCGFSCSYCSSNAGAYLRINRERFAEITEAQTGARTYPADDPTLMFVWPDVLNVLAEQLRTKEKRWGAGKVLMFSQLTDPFSPWLVSQGITRRALEMVLERTSFRIRVLTKSAVVGHDEWREFFAAHRDRVVVGLSVGSLDREWAGRVEIGTSSPMARLGALSALQMSGVPTFGMMCPVFPDALDGDGVERLIEAVRPSECETVWSEPYNDRLNWQAVRAGYDEGSPGWRFFTEVYEEKRPEVWSRYATDLYRRIRARAEREGWLAKLRYLLYEADVTAEDAARLGDRTGILLQSKPAEDGQSANPAFRTAPGVAR